MLNGHNQSIPAVLHQSYRGLQRKRVGLQEQEEFIVEEPPEDEAVKLYREYTGSQVGTLRPIQGTEPFSEEQRDMRTGMEVFFLQPADLY